MNMKLKAAGDVAGVSAVIFGTIAFLNYVSREYAPIILAFGLLAYLIYIMYSIRLSSLENEQRELERVEEVVRTRNLLQSLEQKSSK
jgi:translation elongation factor EF-1beta